jgi:hypothetical protein
MPVALILDDESADNSSIMSHTATHYRGEILTLVHCDDQHSTSHHHQSPYSCVVPMFYDDSEYEDEEEYWSDCEDDDIIEDDAMVDDDDKKAGFVVTTSAMRQTASVQQQQHHQASLMKALFILSHASVDVRDILAVMRAMPWEANVQCFACEKLWVASWDDDTAVQLVAQGGIQLVLEAMSRFPASERLQQCACETLQNVAALDKEESDLEQSPQAEICQRGGTGLLVQAMLNHIHNHSLQLCGCTTLTSLAADHPENHSIIRAEGAVDAILQALRCHGSHQASVADGARQALGALGVRDRADQEMMC